MRPLTRFLSLFLFATTCMWTPALAADEATRTLRLELSSDPVLPFAVENLVGAFRVVPGSGEKVVAIATVHAESEDLARQVRFEQVRGEGGMPTLRVRYPLDRYSTFRYPIGDSESGIARIFGGSTSTDTKYDGHRVKVSSREGVLLYADVEVQLPRRQVQARFRNQAGNLHAERVDGKLGFDAGSGDVTLEKLRGEVRSDTGSGDVKAKDLEGSFVCDTGSGNCDLDGFKGDSITCDVGSGNVSIRSATARRTRVDTGSGNVRAVESDMEEFQADTGSGNVVLEAKGARLVRVAADTGSGDVTLRLAPDATFEALADQGSGDMTVRYPDATPILRHKEVVGYRRGDARMRISVDTGSGDLLIEPGR